MSRVVAPLAYGGAALAVVSLHLATNGVLGFHTDELYYLASGMHPALGYVDFPPIVPLAARLETSLLGVSPWALRVLPTLRGGVMVMLSAAYVRLLGGSLRMQVLALVIAATAPYFLGANWVFQTVTFDELTWMVAIYWFAALLVSRRPRHWIYLGLALGIGLEVKFTIVALIVAIAVAVLVTPPLRAELGTRYPWIAAGLALLIWAPNLWWQVTNDFPTLQYVLNHQGSIASGGGPVTFLLQFFVYLFFILPVWTAGVVSLFRSRDLRPLAIACAIPLVIFLVFGKSYYAVGTVPVVLAQGLVAIARVARPRLRRTFQIGVLVASGLQLVIFAQLTLPITPPDEIHARGLDAMNELFADSVGWDDIAHQVTAVYEELPDSERADTAIISRYYGVPGALEFYGNPARLPAVMSPQLSEWYWLPPHLTATYALMVDYQPADVGWMCNSASVVGHLTVPYDVQGLEQGAPVTLCALREPIASAWPRLRDFT